MIRIESALALLLVIQAANLQAAELTLNFSGTIKSVVDASDVDLPSIDFDPAPVGSPFSGTITYDTDSPLTSSRTGFARYLDLLSSSGSLTVNGFHFATTGSVSAMVVSQEANFGFSGVNLINQPLTLPADWSVDFSEAPYFTLQFRDTPSQTRSLALPSSVDEFPTDMMTLVLDFQQPVTVAGQTYGGRVYITAEITSLGPPPPQEVAINVDPSSIDNVINLKSKKPKPLEVAIFGAVDFDVLAVVPETIELGDPVLTDPVTGSGQKVAPSTVHYVDVDADGELDLLLTFDLLRLQNFGAIDSYSTSLEFQALLDNQGVVFGSDAVSIAGAKGKGKGGK
jgi:hypothetical protein